MNLTKTDVQAELDRQFKSGEITHYQHKVFSQKVDATLDSMARMNVTNSSEEPERKRIANIMANVVNKSRATKNTEKSNVETQEGAAAHIANLINKNR